jgi:hypothetical protein
MSTATNWRERPGDKDSAQSSEATATGLTLVSAGFMLYPTRMVNGRMVASGVAAAKVRGYPHRPMLVIPERSIGQVIGEMPKGESDDVLRYLDVAGYDISMAEQPSGAGALTDRFEMIPMFESFSCGVRLARDWRDRAINTWFTFDAGNVVAVPNRYTLTQTCQWTDCDGHKGQPQRFTDQTTYSPEVQAKSTIFLRSPERSAVIEFIDGPAYVAFTNFLHEDVPVDVGIDLAHIDSMLQLSDTDGEIRFTLGLTTADGAAGASGPEPLAASPIRWPLWLTKVLALNTFVGRPHCGARQMREPDA